MNMYLITEGKAIMCNRYADCIALAYCECLPSLLHLKMKERALMQALADGFGSTLTLDSV